MCSVSKPNIILKVFDKCTTHWENKLTPLLALVSRYTSLFDSQFYLGKFLAHNKKGNMCSIRIRDVALQHTAFDKHWIEWIVHKATPITTVIYRAESGQLPRHQDEWILIERILSIVPIRRLFELNTFLIMSVQQHRVNVTTWSKPCWTRRQDRSRRIMLPHSSIAQ